MILETRKLTKPSEEDALAILIICHTFAMLSASFRLAYRYHIRRLWWDDFWAFVALGSEVISVATYFSIPTSPDARSIGVEQAGRYLDLFFYTTAVWAARLTVSVTIVRLLPPGPLRRGSVWVSGLFAFFWFAMVLQKMILCEIKLGKHDVQCILPFETAVVELCTCILGDIWLISVPVYMVYKMKLRREYHSLIMSLFMCGIFTTLGSVVHKVFLLLGEIAWSAITAQIEVAISIVVSNMLVLVTYLYRRFHHPSEDSQTVPSDHDNRFSRVETGRSIAGTRHLVTYFSNHGRRGTEMLHLGSSFDTVQYHPNTDHYIDPRHPVSSPANPVAAHLKGRVLTT
ncbi:hypothetical protein CPB83DRAFT_681698 [Crepidotus variabilis]|uniref:Rhodopsin domain-containing protein n=1 Tax=Crepidotus variabilis TaxID=179855 RepID=A0A9P6E6Z4_9AGAR|nr:hypothetical protein CPB83DRAFT_681698 [Crepidotus variabilis]